MRLDQRKKCVPHRTQRGFTLVEMIVVIVITGILGGMIAMFISGPVQGYVDSARRAEMTDIADTALRRITRDVRMALPNSVRITAAGAAYYLEFIPTSGGGRYRAEVDPAMPASDKLDFTAADTAFDVLGTMPAFAAGDSVVVNNLGTVGASAYEVPPTNRASWVSNTSTTVMIAAMLFPASSPKNRFQVIATPVTYVCSPAAGGAGGTLTRYWGYATQAVQPNNVNAAPLSGASHALLASNVSACNFANVAARPGLVTVYLTMAESGESISLYDAAYVANVP